MCMAVVPQFCYVTLTLGLGTEWADPLLKSSATEVWIFTCLPIKGDLDATLNP